MLNLNSKLENLREKYKAQGEPILRDETLKILIKKIKEIKPKRVLEIGTSVGLTSVAILLSEKQSKITTIEIDEEKVKKAKEYFCEFNVSDRAKVILGDACEIVPVLTGSYDLILLDGPKGHYFEFLPDLVKSLNKGGILFADDVLFHGYIKGDAPKKHNTIKNSILNYLNAVKESEELESELIEIEDGISIARKVK